jgi:hypothetical protein
MILLASMIFGAVGWWLGSQLGLMTAVVLSAVGSGYGIWWGRRQAQRWGM